MAITASMKNGKIEFSGRQGHNLMKYYFAPMEGITGYIYRNAYHTFFETPDKYFTPFISPNQNRCLGPKELNDILPEHNQNMTVVPQLLTNRADYFSKTEKEIKALGYTEINLNLGCPSGTVVSKGKGSGFLAKPEELDVFLENIFANAVTKISIKTRLGKKEPEEFYQLIEIFNKYPLEELIIHPRIQKDFYKNSPNLTVFKDALHKSKHSICYNGDIFNIEDYHTFTAEFRSVQKIMLGRGILINPVFLGLIKGQEPVPGEILRRFHNTLYGEYQKVLPGDKAVLFKMKELWSYWIKSFPDSEKYAKRIRKAEKLAVYENVMEDLFV